MKAKMFFTVLIWVLFCAIEKAFYPVITTEVALTQAQDSMSSLTNIRLYQMMWSWFMLIPAGATIAIFWSNIKNTINSIKEKN